ncbi:hypothetical protein MLD38_007439 [Melastoma candidum]|uniref:Uncharacterized protein n=1 Tax=Melastoma candidum TaxID=119954 RepID=A0ACB9RQC6_9MYRT|nr:hypothetical protein MLD38_007439 [Melastoma candidum]
MLASSWLQDSMLGTACSGISVARTDCGSHLSLESQHGDIQDVDTGLYSCHSSSSAHYEGENRQNMYFWQQRDSRGGESMTASTSEDEAIGLEPSNSLTAIKPVIFGAAGSVLGSSGGRTSSQAFHFYRASLNQELVKSASLWSYSGRDDRIF